VESLRKFPEIPVATKDQTSPRVTCTSCVLREFCLPPGLSRDELASAEHLVSTRLRIKRGSALYRSGDAFRSLYVVRVGSLKSTVASDDAREQVTGFHLAGDMLGFDGMGAGSHACDAVALEDTEVCVFPYCRIEEAAETMPSVRQHFYRLMSREIVRKHASMLMLGSMDAGERLATFLLDLSVRFELRGYSRTEFVLRMTRAEIGSFLGISLETVSRLMSQFTRDGVIDLTGVKQVKIVDPDRLRRLALGQQGDTRDRPQTRDAVGRRRAFVQAPAKTPPREALVAEFA
jgi:CRP/FNR family transcriptional regulator